MNVPDRLPEVGEIWGWGNSKKYVKFLVLGIEHDSNKDLLPYTMRGIVLDSKETVVSDRYSFHSYWSRIA